MKFNFHIFRGYALTPNQKLNFNYAMKQIVTEIYKKIKDISVFGMGVNWLHQVRRGWFYSLTLVVLLILSVFSAGLFRPSLPSAVVAALIFLMFVVWFVKKGKEWEKIVEAKAEFVSIASHDIRSPLNGILWSLESLFSKSVENLTEDQKTTLRLVEQSCRNLLGTVNELLNITPLEKEGIRKLAIKECDLVSLIQKVIDDLDLIAKKNSINIIMGGNAPQSVIAKCTLEETFKCDPDKIKRVFSNILDNAIKYSRLGSKVEIDCQRKDKSYLISFRDYGIGISPDEQFKIFRGFFRAENAKQFSPSGTGLGLYYARKVIELHGGKIWFESEENKGTTFFVELK